MDERDVQNRSPDCASSGLGIEARIAPIGIVFPGVFTMKVPEVLDAIAKTVLAYRPPEKAKTTAKREKKRRKRVQK